MSDIFDEVLAEKKRLLEVAEINAKNKIIDKITPKIKQMVQNAVMGKLNEDITDDDEDILLSALSDEQPSPAPMVPSPQENASMTLPGPDGKVTIDVDAVANSASAPVGDPLQALVTQGGEQPLQTDPTMGVDVDAPVVLDDEFELTPESLQLINNMLNKSVSVDVGLIETRISTLKDDVEKLVATGCKTSADKEKIRQVRVECERRYKNVQEASNISDSDRTRLSEGLENVFGLVMKNYSAAGHITSIVRDVVKINKAAGAINASINESISFEQTTKCVDMLKELAELHANIKGLYETRDIDNSVDAETIKQVGANLAILYTEIMNMTKNKQRINEADELDAMANDSEAGAPDVEKMLVQLQLPVSLSDVGVEDVEVVSVQPSSSGDEMDMDADMDMSADDDLGGDDLGDMDMDMGSDELGSDESPVDVDEMQESALNDDDIIEIDEAALVKELKRMKQLREKKEKAQVGNGPGEKLSDFGGGKKGKEPFVDVDDADLNVLDESDAPDEDEDEDELEESVKASSRKQKQSKASANDTELVESKKLRAELKEQKLFNMKLVALNKVLQIPGLTENQKKKVVEALDKGKTVAEVGQLYSNIVNKLKNASAKLDESTNRVLGAGSSRSTTSGGASKTAQDNPLVERWNKIAFGDDKPTMLKD